MTISSGSEAPVVSAVAGFGLIELALALGGGPGQVPAFQDRQKLSLRHMVAAIDQELLHRRADLGRDAGLVQRVEHAVRGDDAADGFLAHGRHLNRRDRLHLRLFSFFEQPQVASQTRRR